MLKPAALALMLGLLPAGPAAAAPVEPRAIEPRAFDRGSKAEKPIARDTPLPARGHGRAAPADRKAPPQGAETFRLNGIQLSGNTIFSEKELEPSYASLIGSDITPDDLVRLTDALTARYVEAGYFLSRAFVPAQDIAGGVVAVQIVEGHVGNVQFKSQAPVQQRLEPFAQAIIAERPLQLAVLERQLLLVTQIDGMEVTDTVIDETEDFSGLFTLTVEISFDPMKIDLAADTYGTREVGRLQGQANIRLNGLAGERGTLNATLGGVPHDPREWTYGALGYDFVIRPGLSLGAGAALGRLQPDGIDRILGLEEWTLDGDIRVGYVPLIARDRLLRFDARLSVANTVGDDDFGPVARDRVRSLALSATLFRELPREGGVTALIDLERGLDIWGASERGDFYLSRGDARAAFTKLSGQVIVSQPLVGAFSVWLQAAGQVSSTPVLSSREFYLGGARFGRGYEPGTLSGDLGAAAAGELRYGRDTDWRWLSGWQVYGFLDGGAVWQKGIRDSRISLVSAGAGLRLFLPEDLQISAEIGVPLTYVEDPDRDQRPRVNVSVSKSF